MMPASTAELQHEIRRLQAENGDLRAALTKGAEELGRDTEADERASSRFWFASWRNSQITNQRQREQLIELRALVRDLLQAKDRAPASQWHEIVGARFAALDQAVRRG